MLALRWGDIDFKRRHLVVQEAVWEAKTRDENGRKPRITDTPKGGRSRVVPLRYMHLSPAARQDATALLNARPEAANAFGDIVETRVAEPASIGTALDLRPDATTRGGHREAMPRPRMVRA